MEIKKNNSVTLILIAGVIILLGSAFFLFYTNLQQKQQTTSKAFTPMCHNGGPPLPIDPECSDELLRGHVLCQNIDSCTGLSAAQKATIQSSQCPTPQTKIAGSALPAGHGCRLEYGCTAPHEGYCKEKGDACYECRFGDSRGLVTGICPCKAPSPTVPVVEKPKCEPPYQCLPKEECVPDSIRDSSSVNTTVNTGSSCGPSSYCCIKRQPTPTTSICPPVGTVGKVEVSCPLCENK